MAGCRFGIRPLSFMGLDLHTLLSTPWNDPRARIVEILGRIAAEIEAHDTTTHPARLERIAATIAEARPDTAPALWLAERLLDHGFQASEIASSAVDLGWAETLALELVDAGTIGVVSLGASTRACLASLATIRTETPVVRAASSVVARGIDDLGVVTEISDPVSADRCLVPVAASSAGRIWTSAAAARALTPDRGNVVVLDDPIRRLGVWAVARWAPPEWAIGVDAPDRDGSSRH